MSIVTRSSGASLEEEGNMNLESVGNGVAKVMNDVYEY